MKVEDFNHFVDDVLEHVRSTLFRKSTEYATEDDRLHNFRNAARLRNTTTAKALDGMKVKHDMSVLDLIEWDDVSPERVTAELLEEKFTDSIAYNILLWAILEQNLISRTKKVKE